MNGNQKKIANELDELALDVDTNSHSPLRWGLAVLLIGFGGFIYWAAFAPLDAGIPADATVHVAGNRKTIQHLEGGTTEDILVREGDKVIAGQVLVRLNQTRALAEQGVVSAQYITARAIEARLLAERDNLSTIVHDPQVMERFKDDPRFIEATRAQARLFLARREALNGEIAILTESQRGAEAQLKGLTQVHANRGAQVSFINR
ncbi:MAG TPA: hemolysin D, partial [Candidimonas sp.]|nr:hemolysin D [Candidimonas sp.]